VVKEEEVEEPEEEEEEKKPAKSKKGKKKEEPPEDEEVEEAEEEEKPKAKAKGKAKAKTKGKKEAPAMDMSYPGGNWKWNGTLLYWPNSECKGNAKIASFDFDSCLAKTSLFKKGPDAWSMLFPEVPTILKKLHADGYKVVIFTNQSDIGKMVKPETRKKAIDEKLGRLQSFVSKVGIPIQVFIATVKAPKNEGGEAYDLYRKPATGMWKFMIESCNDGVKPDMKTSFFCGDAAGRKNDHGSSDKDFAAAVPLTYYTETNFFVDGEGPGK